MFQSWWETPAMPAVDLYKQLEKIRTLSTFKQWKFFEM